MYSDHNRIIAFVAKKYPEVKDLLWIVSKPSSQGNKVNHYFATNSLKMPYLAFEVDEDIITELKLVGNLISSMHHQCKSMKDLQRTLNKRISLARLIKSLETKKMELNMLQEYEMAVKLRNAVNELKGYIALRKRKQSRGH